MAGFRDNKTVGRILLLGAMGIFMSVVSMNANVIAWRYSQNITANAIVAVAAGIVGTGLFLLVLHFVSRSARQAVSLSDVGIFCLVLAMSWWWFATGHRGALQRPRQITIPAEQCQAFELAADEAGRPRMMPCTFRAYVFPDGHGSYYTYGASENVKGKCYWLTGAAVDVFGTDVDWKAPKMPNPPTDCMKNLVPFDDRQPQSW